MFHDCLGSSVFVNAETPWEDYTDKVFASVARELSARDSIIQKYVVDALRKDPSLTAACPHRQFEQLIQLPAQKSPKGKPLVVILDGLQKHGRHSGLPDLLVSAIKTLPARYRIIITGRSRDEIVDNQSSSIRQFTLPHEGDTVISDMTLYITARTKEFANRHRDNRVDPTIIRRLVDLSAGSFLFAKMACDLIEFRTANPEARPHNPLDLQNYKDYLTRHSCHPASNIKPEFDKFLLAADVSSENQIDRPTLKPAFPRCLMFSTLRHWMQSTHLVLTHPVWWMSQSKRSPQRRSFQRMAMSLP
jgi:hypothetical protein